MIEILDNSLNNRSDVKTTIAKRTNFLDKPMSFLIVRGADILKNTVEF